MTFLDASADLASIDGRLARMLWRPTERLPFVSTYLPGGIAHFVVINPVQKQGWPGWRRLRRNPGGFPFPNRALKSKKGGICPAFLSSLFNVAGQHQTDLAPTLNYRAMPFLRPLRCLALAGRFPWLARFTLRLFLGMMEAFPNLYGVSNPAVSGPENFRASNSGVRSFLHPR